MRIWADLHRCSQLYNQAVGRDEAGVLAVLAPGGFEETCLGIPLQSVISEGREFLSGTIACHESVLAVFDGCLGEVVAQLIGSHEGESVIVGRNEDPASHILDTFLACYGIGKLVVVPIVTVV